MLTATAPSPPAKLTDRRVPHAVVIGSGFGGLAAAVRLGARGYRVTVLEKLDAPGGRAYVFRQDGFTFDAGPTIITAPFLFEELWQLAGRRFADDVELRPMSPFYRIRFHDGETFDCVRRPRGDARRGRAFVAVRCCGLRTLHAVRRGDLQARLRAARTRPVQLVEGHGAGRCRTWCGSRATAASTASSRST